MVKDAKEHEEEDRRKRDEAEARNQADSLVYTTEKMLSEIGDKVSGEQKGKIDSGMKSLKEALGGNDIANIRKETESLQKAVGEAGASIYQKAAEEAAAKAGKEGPKEEGSAGKGKKGKEDDAVDAEYKVDDEGKKG